LNCSLKITFLAAAYAVVSVTLNCCNKEEDENLKVFTSPVSEITYHSAVSGVEWQGRVDQIKEGGICYSQKSNPTWQDSVATFDIDRIDTASELWFGQLSPNTT